MNREVYRRARAEVIRNFDYYKAAGKCDAIVDNMAKNQVRNVLQTLFVCFHVKSDHIKKFELLLFHASMKMAEFRQWQLWS